MSKEKNSYSKTNLQYTDIVYTAKSIQFPNKSNNHKLLKATCCCRYMVLDTELSRNSLKGDIPLQIPQNTRQPMGGKQTLGTDTTF